MARRPIGGPGDKSPDMPGGRKVGSGNIREPDQAGSQKLVRPLRATPSAASAPTAEFKPGPEEHAPVGDRVVPNRSATPKFDVPSGLHLRPSFEPGDWIQSAPTAGGTSQLASARKAIDALRSDVPLLLMPVRIETRFTPAPSRKLRVRIFPDQIALDGLDRRLSREEAKAGRAFLAAYDAAEDDDARAALWAGFADCGDPWRAAWIARSLRAGTARSDRGAGEADDEEDAIARCPFLPECWLVTGTVGAASFHQAGNPIPPDLAFSPDLGAVFDLGDDVALDPALSWMVDFDEARRQGMALEVALPPEAQDGIDTLFVLGVAVGEDGRLAPGRAARKLDRLFESQLFDWGAGFVPDGLASNNTRDVQSPWSAANPDLETLRLRVLGSGGEAVMAQSPGTEPALVPGEGLCSATGPDRAAAIAARALGLPEDGSLAMFEHSDATGRAAARAMNRLLWPVTLGEMFGQLLSGPDENYFEAETIGWLRDWFCEQITGGSPIAAIRVGSMPYGVLPVESFSLRREMAVEGDEARRRQLLSARLRGMLPEWRAASSRLLRMAAEPQDISGFEDPGARLVGILQQDANPAHFWQSEGRNLRGIPNAIYEFNRAKADPAADPPAVAAAFDLDREVEFTVARVPPLSGLKLKARAYSLLEQMWKDAGFTAYRDWPARFTDGDAQKAFLAEKLAQVRGTRDPASADGKRIFQSPEIFGTGMTLSATALHAKLVAPWQTHYDELETALQGMLDQVVEHEAGSSLFVQALDPPSDLYRGVVGEDDRDPKLTYLGFGELEEWREDALVEVPVEAGESVPFANYAGELAALAQHYLSGSPAPATTTFPRNRKPLLYQLLRQAIIRTGSEIGEVAPITPTPRGGIGKVRLPPGGLVDPKRSELREMADALDLLLPLNPTQLALLTTQTLGLASWRLDAWLTSLTMRRIEDIRASGEQTRQGLQVGAFGWVEGLKPRDQAAGGTSSDGFIHTPSLNHARAAAVLRSGWRAYGMEESGYPLAVDLSSERMRHAQWTFDAIRQGQDLGDLLGREFERHLRHVALAPEWIYPVRQATLTLAGERADAQLPVVDGLLLHRLWRDDPDGIEREARAELVRLGGPASAALDPVRRTMATLDERIDGLADAGLAEAVFALVQGNHSRAGASLSAISDGLEPPPRLSMLETTPSTLTLTQRVVIVAPETGGWVKPGTGACALADADPRAEAIAAELLGDPAGLGFLLHGLSASGAAVTEVTVSWKDVLRAGKNWSGGALAFLAALAGEGWSNTCELAFRLAGHASRLPSFATADTVTVSPDTETLAALERAVAWRQVLYAARPMHPRDCPAATGSTGGAVIDIGGIEHRSGKAVARFRRAAQALIDLLPEAAEGDPQPLGDESPATLGAILLDLLASGWRQAAQAALVANGRSVSAENAHSACWQLMPQLREALASLDGGEAESSDSEARLRAARRRLDLVFGKAVPGLADFVPAEPGVVLPALAAASLGSADPPRAAEAWLERMAYVREPLRRFGDALLLDECADPLFERRPLRIAQWPGGPDMPWIALNRPDGAEAPRCSLVMLDLAGWSPANPPVRLAGLVVDEIIDRVPDQTVTTGLAFHFDAPGNEAPQAMLLALPPQGEQWSHELLLDTLQDTLTLAKARLVDSDSMDDFNGILPAIFADPGLAAVEA